MLSSGVDFQYESWDLANGFNLSSIFPFGINFTDDQFWIKFKNGKMLVSANIRDSSNVLIAQIADNSWGTLNPDTLLFWDRNYNAYAFEIIGSNNVPTLQVIMVGENKIQLGGLFHTREGSIYIAPLPSGDAEMYVNIGSQHQEYQRNIARIFQYPALTNPDNLGKMVNSTYASSNPLFIPNLTIAFGIFTPAIGTILGIVGFEMYKSSNEELAQRASVTRRNIGWKLRRKDKKKESRK